MIDDKIKSQPFGNLLCGKGENPGAIQSGSFLVWKKSIRVRFAIESIINFFIYAFL